MSREAAMPRIRTRADIESDLAYLAALARRLGTDHPNHGAVHGRINHRLDEWQQADRRVPDRARPADREQPVRR